VQREITVSHGLEATDTPTECYARGLGDGQALGNLQGTQAKGRVASVAWQLKQEARRIAGSHDRGSVAYALGLLRGYRRMIG
jgi:hypothetical protein